MRLFIRLISPICLIWLICASPTKALAGTDPISDTATISATVKQQPGKSTTPPTVPALYQPEDGTITSDNRRNFSWYQSSDPNGNTVTYTLYLNGVATYLGISNLGNSAGSGYSAQLDGSLVRLHPTVSLPDGTYDWYVTAENPAGATSRSATWHLTIDTTTPVIIVTDIDTYHNLNLNSGDPASVPPELNFDVDGPKDISFTLHTKIYAKVTLQFYDADNQLVASVTSLSDNNGILQTYRHLAPGLYLVQISAVDQAGQAGALPTFHLTVHQAALALTIPGSPPYSIPYTPYSIPSLPATIANLQTPGGLASITILLIALGIIWLLIFLWRRRYNLVLLDPAGHPLHHAVIYHSNPGSHTLYSIHHTLYYKSYLPHLGRYSTLTIRLQSETTCSTYILSLCGKRGLYTVILG